MNLRTVAITGCLALVALVVGCKCPSGGCVPRTPCAPCSLEPAEVIGPQPDLLGTGCPDCELTPLPAPTETYYMLSAEACQCSAATNAPLANMVELERFWAKVVIECDTDAVGKNYSLERDLLSLRATEIRNEAAASALEAYYQLAGLETQKHFLELAVKETEQTLQRINNFREKELPLPEAIDQGTIETQLHELKDQQLQLDFLRLQLNGQLQKLVGCPLDERNFYWPQVEWDLDPEPIDVEVELADGLAHRTDLRGLQLLICKMDKITLPVVRAVLSYADSTVGSVEPRDGLRHVIRCFHCNKTEVPVRCRQLSIFYTHTENLAVAQIKGAAYKVLLQQQRVANAQQTVAKFRDRVEELNKTRHVENVAIFEISKARGDLYQAESELIKQAVALEVARVDLRKSQGTLALECGFAPCICNEGCCDGACCRCAKKGCGCRRK